MNNRSCFAWFCALAVGLVLWVSCCREEGISVSTPQKQFFLDQSEYGVYSRGSEILAYEPVHFQLAISPRRNLFRLQDDLQLRYAQVVFESVPKRIGDRVEAHCLYRVGSLNLDIKVSMECSRISSTSYWFWNDQHQLGYLVPAEVIE